MVIAHRKCSSTILNNLIFFYGFRDVRKDFASRSSSQKSALVMLPKEVGSTSSASYPERTYLAASAASERY